MTSGFQDMSIESTLALQFLAPNAGLIAAGLAIPALLFFYFLKLRRRPMRVSSTLFWEQAVNDLQVNAPIRWIRPSLLLLIQFLALLCLILAIARPAIEGGEVAGRIAILIDASASMGATDAGQSSTRLDRAKAGARGYLDSLPAETEVIVLEMTGQTRTLTNFTRNRGLARNAIESIEQSDQPARLADALEVLGAFVGSPAEDGAGTAQPDAEPDSPPRVVLFSDGAFPDPPEDRSVSGTGDLEFDFTFIGPEIEQDGSDQPPQAVASENVAIIGLSVRRDLDDPASVRVFTRIQSTFPDARPITLRCSIDGEVLAVATPTLPAPEPDTVGSALVPSSETTYTFDIGSPGGGLLTVSAEVEDALDADNRVWLVLPPPRSLNLLLIRPDGPMTNGSANLAFALETMYPAPRRVRVATRSEADREGLLSPPADAGFDAAVYDSISPESLPELPALYFNAAPPLPGVSIASPEDPRSSEFLFWRRSHPVMRDVIPDGVVIYRRSDLTLSDAGAATDPPTDGPVVRSTELASDPSPLIALLEHGRTRSIVVAFDLDDTNWWQDRSFPIFIQNAIDFLALSTDTQTGRVIRTTDPLRITAAEAEGGASLIDAEGGAIRVPTPASEEPVLIPPLRRAGIYELLPSKTSTADPRLIAVNLMDPFESLCAAAPSIEIGGRVTSASGEEGTARREIWNWFILAAAVLLIVEWLIFDRKMRI